MFKLIIVVSMLSGIVMAASNVTTYERIEIKVTKKCVGPFATAFFCERRLWKKATKECKAKGGVVSRFNILVKNCYSSIRSRRYKNIVNSRCSLTCKIYKID